VAVEAVCEQWDQQRGAKEREQRYRLLLAPGRWLLVQETRSTDASSNQPRSLQWCTPEERGVLIPSRGLGAVRPARPEDAVTCPMPFPVGLLQDLTATVSAGGSAILERLPDGRLRLAFAWGSVHSAYVVDGARHVVLEWETGQQGPRGPYPPVRYEGFVEAGGCWWPGRAVQRDATGALAQQVPFAVRDLGTADFEEQWTAALGVRRACLVLPCPLASRQELIAAWHSGSVTVPQRYALARHFVDTAQWSRAEEQLGALRGAGVPELAIDEMSTALLRGTQGTGPWLDACLARARRLAERPQPDELALAVAWFGYPRQPFGGEDRLRLLEALAPVFARQPEWLDAGRMVRQFRIEALFEAGRQAEAEALQRETLTAERPADFAGPFAHGMLDPNRTPLYRKDLLAQDAWVREHLLPASGASSETESMLVSYCEAQLNGGRPAAALSLLEAWRQQVAASVPPAQPGPTSSGGLEWQRAQGHWRYLQAMAREGREKDADQLAATWLRRTTSGGPLSAREQAEAGAALRYATTGPQEMFVSHHVEAPLADALLSASLAALQRPDLEWLATEVVYSSSGFHWGHRDAFEAAWLAHNAGGPARNPAAFPRPPATAFLERLGKQGLSETEEGEALARVGGLESAAGAECDPALRVNLLASVVDAMVQSRFARRLGRDCAAPGALAADPDAACLAALRQARSETRECLAIESRQAPEALRSWYELERQWLDLLTGTDPEGLAAECRRALGETVPTGAARVSWLDAIPTAQRLAVLKRLCLTEGAPPARAEALLAYLAAGTASPADARVWKLHRLSLLLALDQRRELEEVLTGWVRDEPADPTWRIALGYCLARQDRLAEAIAQFETAAEPFGLPQREARLLGAWRLLVDSDSSSPAALAPSARPDFTRLAIRDLLGLLKADDPNADLALTAAETREALLCLARREPRLVLDAVELLATAYSRNRDPRLLAVVPELLQEADLPAPFAFAARVHRLLSRLNDEAAVSALAASLHEARPRLTGDRARAADLVEVACLALLTAVGPAATGDLSQAEALLERAAGATQDGTGRGALIGLLLAWGQVAEGPLRQAQTHWLGVLLADPAASLTPRRRDLCLSYARLLWSYQRRDEAVAILERALALLPTQGTAPSFGSGDQVLETLTGYLREAGQMPRCETLLLSRLDQATEAAQRAGLEEALGTLWVQALGGKAVLAVGPGQGLYDDAHRQLRAWLDAAVGQHFAKLAEHLCALHQAAHQAGCTGVTERLDELCLAVPRLLADQIAGFQEQDVIKAVATARHDVLGARSALLMLTEQIENEPCRLRYDHRPGWAEHAETIVAWTAEVGADAELDRRLGNLALRELRGFLHSDHETWTPEIHYQRGSGAFRGDLVSSFADTAEAEAQANPDDGFVTTQAGFYLADELGLPERAAALLAAADARGRLDRTGRLERARCTLAAGHAVEAAALAGRLATDLAATQIGPRHDRRIQALDAQVVWLEALASAGDDRGFAAALAATEADLRRLDVRRLEAVTRLTQTCLEGRRFADSARLFGSALALHALTARFREKPAARFPLLEGLIASYRGRGQAKAAAEVCRNWLSRGDLDSTERNALASLLDGGGGSATGLPAAEATSPPGG
jgi:hypothetical protein